MNILRFFLLISLLVIVGCDRPKQEKSQAKIIKYEVVIPDEGKYLVEAPDNWSDEQVYNAVKIYRGDGPALGVSLQATGEIKMIDGIQKTCIRIEGGGIKSGASLYCR